MKKTLTLIAIVFALNLNAQETGELTIQWNKHEQAGANVMFEIFSSTDYEKDIEGWERLAVFDSYNANSSAVVTNHLLSLPKTKRAFYMRTV